ncbi:MAG TPA: SDR family oxidoreductase [Burkholderiaceae bacterium]|nr:SDR family oxidoreductase [Burkholderiaceae bacterium]
MPELQAKVAIVTGAGSGIGRGIALGFLREGASVVAADIDAAKAEETAALARAEGWGDAVLVQRTDVTQEAEVEAVVRAAVARFGRLDCMVNNAGGPGAMEPLLDMPTEGFDGTLALLLRSVFLGIKHAGRVMRAQGEGGIILSTASIAAQMCGASPSVYAAAKAGVVQLSRMAAAELGAYRIRVNTVSPGAIYVPGFALGGVSKQQLTTVQSWPEAGMPADVAAAMVFLAGDRCHFATGADFVVDGGLIAHGSRTLERLYGAQPNR